MSVSPQLDLDDLRPWFMVTFSRSPGPGGQNVNKVNTQVTLLFDYEACTALTPRQKTTLQSRLRTRISREGKLRVVSRKGRSQWANRQAAELRLLALLQDALTLQTPRHPTRPTRSSKRARLANKRHQGELKQMRRRKNDDW